MNMTVTDVDLIDQKLVMTSSNGKAFTVLNNEHNDYKYTGTVCVNEKGSQSKTLTP